MNYWDLRIQRHAMGATNSLGKAWHARTKKGTVLYAFAAGGSFMALVEAVLRRVYP